LAPPTRGACPGHQTDTLWRDTGWPLHRDGEVLSVTSAGVLCPTVQTVSIVALALGASKGGLAGQVLRNREGKGFAARPHGTGCTWIISVPWETSTHARTRDTSSPPQNKQSHSHHSQQSRPESHSQDLQLLIKANADPVRVR
jgi:hypothetical protein